MKGWEMELLNNVEKEFGSIPPQWVAYPEYHPVCIGWRMGGGESYATAWHSWWQEQDFTLEQKIAYFKQYELPKAWLETLIYLIYENEIIEEFGEEVMYDLDEDELLPYFENLEKLGFGSYEEWIEDYNSERWD